MRSQYIYNSVGTPSFVLKYCKRISHSVSSNSGDPLRQFNHTYCTRQKNFPKTNTRWIFCFQTTRSACRLARTGHARIASVYRRFAQTLSPHSRTVKDRPSFGQCSPAAASSGTLPASSFDEARLLPAFNYAEYEWGHLSITSLYYGCISIRF